MSDEVTGQGQTMTRKPRADKGKPRVPRAGPFILQFKVVVQNSVEQGESWEDCVPAQTEAKAWAAVVEPGTYRVVRQHGKQRTATKQTVMKWE